MFYSTSEYSSFTFIMESRNLKERIRLVNIITYALQVLRPVSACFYIIQRQCFRTVFSLKSIESSEDIRQRNKRQREKPVRVIFQCAIVRIVILLLQPSMLNSAIYTLPKMEVTTGHSFITYEMIPAERKNSRGSTFNIIRIREVCSFSFFEIYFKIMAIVEKVVGGSMKFSICASSATLFILGLTTSITWWYPYNEIVLKKLPLSTDSETFDMWTRTHIPVYFKVYLFNWTNAESTVSNRGKPELCQVGPYVYRLEIERDNFTWNANDTLTYSTINRFYFVPSLSKGNPYSDVVTTPNIIAITVLRKLVSPLPKLFENPTGSTAQSAINLVSSTKLYVQKTVSEILFDGYEDTILSKFKWPAKVIDVFRRPDEKIPRRFPGYLPINGTKQYTYNIHTGKSDVNKLGFLHSHNYRTQLPPFHGSCSEVGLYGSSVGDFWPVNITKESNISIFIPDFCSSIQLRKVGPYMVNGVEGVKYSGDENTFGYECPVKNCYCKSTSDCSLKPGVRDLSSCVPAPVFISFPHFYAADSSYVENVKGLRPNKNLHTFQLTLQKDYGMLLNGAIRLQINVELKRFPGLGLSMFENLPEVVIPTFWFETIIDLPPAAMDKLYFAFTGVPILFQSIGIMMIVLSLIIIFVYIIVLLLLRTQRTGELNIIEMSKI